MEMPEKTAGGIVLGDGGTIAMVKSKNSQSWLFPKGHVESGETDEQAALREINEECGIDQLEYIDDLGEFIRGATGDFNEKTVHMFLFAAPAHAKLVPSLEIQEARWVPFRETAELLGTPHTEWFIKDRAWFASVFDRIREAIQRD
jgi:8-oxo-dGTP pyrophosphatase MutT (NUDIX family)